MAPRAARSGILTIVIGTRKRFFRNVRDAAHALATTGCIRAHACIARRLRLTSNDGGDLRNSPHTAPIRLRSPPSLVSMIADIGTTGGLARPLRGRQEPNASPNVQRTYRDVLGKYPWPLPFPPASSNDGKCRCAGGAAELSAILRGRAEVAESVDAADSKSAALKSVWVRVPPSAPGLTAASAAVCFLRAAAARVDVDHR